MTSIRKIAQVAGVSHITVSRALRNDPRVRQETRDRIVKLAHQYDYRPVNAQQAFAQSGFPTIGCVVSSLSDAFYTEIIEAVLKHAFSRSYHVVILSSSFDPVYTNQALLTLIEQKVKGVLLLSGIDPPPVSLNVLLELWSNDVVPIAIDKPSSTQPIDLIWNDEEQMAMLAVEYLASLGHRDIAFLTALFEGKHHLRFTMMQNALKAHGLSTRYCIEIPLTASYDEQISQLLKAHSPPTAIIGFNDFVASRVIQTLTVLGVRIPEDISVLGCGNFAMCACMQPPLTSIDQHPREIGLRAAELLIKYIEERSNDEEEHTPQEIKILSSLCERASCGPPPKRSRR